MMACLFCDQTPATRDAVKTLGEIAEVMHNAFWAGPPASLAARVYEMYRTLQRVVRDRDRLKEELMRTYEQIRELQNMLSEWQNRQPTPPLVCTEVKDGRWNDFAWNDPRRYSGGREMERTPRRLGRGRYASGW